MSSIGPLKKLLFSAVRICRTPHFLRLRRSYTKNVEGLKQKAKGVDDRKKRILISRIYRLGDIVAAEPISRTVHKLYPSHEIHWCVRPEYANLVRGFRAVDSVLEVTCLTEAMRLARSGLFDRSFELHFEGEYCRACKTPLRGLSGDPKITMTNYINQPSLLTAFSRAGGIEVAEQQPELVIPKETVSRIDEIKLPPAFIVAHCLSVQAEKNWHKAKWLELFSAVSNEIELPIVEIGLKPVIAGSRFRSGDFINLCGRLAILETAEVIRRASIFIGLDSGPAHLANAVCTPGVVFLTNYTNLKGFMPFSGRYADPAFALKVLLDGGTGTVSPQELLQQGGVGQFLRKWKSERIL